MHVLDLDLDFFLNGIAKWVSDYGSRLDEGVYCPWPEVDVRAFLEEQCGLSIQRPVKGRVVEHHHEAFLLWRELVESGELKIPFHVVHIDAHSDLGCGDAGYWYIMTALLHKTPKGRMWPDVKQLKPGNYLLFAAACRWISRITFVLHPKRKKSDLILELFKDGKTDSGYLQLKKYERGLVVDHQHRSPVLEHEPEIPVEWIPLSEYLNEFSFDFGVLSHSPGYTPESSDSLIPVIKAYLEEI